MTRREAFRSLIRDFIIALSRYSNVEPELVPYVTERIESEIPKLLKSLELNGLPPATPFFREFNRNEKQPESTSSMLISDFGATRFFFGLELNPRLDSKLEGEMPYGDD